MKFRLDQMFWINYVWLLSNLPVNFCQQISTLNNAPFFRYLVYGNTFFDSTLNKFKWEIPISPSFHVQLEKSSDDDVHTYRFFLFFKYFVLASITLHMKNCADMLTIDYFKVVSRTILFSNEKLYFEKFTLILTESSSFFSLDTTWYLNTYFTKF